VGERIALKEHGRVAPAGLTVDIARTFAATGAVHVSQDLAGKLWLKASSTVGLIRAGDVELVIRPKVGVGRLLWLLGYAANPSGWRDDDVTLDEHDDLVAATAVAFATRTGKALAGGLLRGYRAVDEASPVLRGRLREADQMRDRLGVAAPLDVQYEDYTADIPENRILAAATRRLLRLPLVPPKTRATLHRIAAILMDVTPLADFAQVPATVETRLTSRYQPALRLARLVLAQRGVELPPHPRTGTVAASGFLFDMNKIYEDWLTATLRRALERHGGNVVPQHLLYLDAARGLPAVKPDITWWNGGACQAVIDAKYATFKKTAPTEHLYQLLAYANALGLHDAHLVYAGGIPTHYDIFKAGIRLHVHVLNLAAPAPALLAQVDLLAGHIHGL
jgi:5-methylcytosine-specific restriction enzyme subunit McrC